MKSKTFTRITTQISLLIFALIIPYVGSATDIVGFTLTADGSATSGISTNSSCTFSVTGLTGNFNSSGYNAYGWNSVGNDCYKTSAFSTEGFITLAVSGQIKAVTTGPRDLKAQYSLNGSTWTDVPNDVNYTDDNPLLTLTTEPTSFTFRLPTLCENKSTVFIRLLQNGTTSVNGGAINTNSSSTSSLIGVVISGEAFIAPTTQASNISIISVTPTTIKIGCTKGSGNRRIIVMNSTNSFPNYSNDDNPSANSTYGGSGVQVVYNGISTSQTVTVASSQNIYWFRIYEYNIMDNLTRFNNNTTSGNPKECALESIHSPTSTNIGLINVTLGATIVSPARGSITERGIYWRTTPGVTESDFNISESSNQAGIYTVFVDGVDRGTTIYYKGYVVNTSGKILSEEASFSNIPIFTGTGTWETATSWNVQEVPGEHGDPDYGSIDDSPIINGTCTLTADNEVTNLTINSGKVLNISPAKGLSVDGDITNNGGTAGLKLLSTSGGTGSLLHNTANVNATIERYIAGTNNDLGAKAYHLVSVPINSATYLSGMWLDSYLFTYLENSNTWFNWDDPTGNILNTNTGAMVYYSFGPSKTYNITGQLNNGTYSPAVAYSGSGKGYNLVPNPYPSAINWDAASGWTKTNISPTIYGFNPASKSYGSWNGSVSTESITGIIPVGQAFFVVATGSPTLTMTNSVRLHDTKAFLKSGETAPDVLHLIAAGNEAQNEIAIQFADKATVNGGDDLDAVKFYSDMTVPQLSSFTTYDPSLLSINAIPYLEGNTEVPLHFDMDYTGEITFTASGMESFENSTTIKLEDKQLNQLVDLRAHPVYSLSHTPTDSPERFLLHFGGVLGTETPVTEKLSKITISENMVYLDYPASNNNMYASLYDIQGKLVNSMRLNNSGQDHLCISSDGIFILKLTFPTGTETHKIVVR